MNTVTMFRPQLKYHVFCTAWLEKDDCIQFLLKILMKSRAFKSGSHLRHKGCFPLRPFCPRWRNGFWKSAHAGVTSLKNKARFARASKASVMENDHKPKHKGLIPRALFLGEMRNISLISFEMRPPEYIISTWLLTIQKKLAKYFAFRWKISPVESGLKERQKGKLWNVMKRATQASP